MGYIMYLRRFLKEPEPEHIPVVSYHGTLTNMKAAHYDGASGNTGDYLYLFGNSTVVSCYDEALTLHTVTALTSSSTTSWGYRGSGAAVGDKVFYNYGYNTSSKIFPTAPDVYDNTLTKHTAGAYACPRTNAACAAISDKYVMFAFGEPDYDQGYDDNGAGCGEVYDTNLTRVGGPRLAWYTVVYSAMASVGEYAIHSAGQSIEDGQHYSNCYDWVTAVSDTLTVTTLNDSLAAKVSDHSAIGVGDYAIFAGGSVYEGASSSTGISISGKSANVEAYDKNLTKVIADDLSLARYNMAVASYNDAALFAGGINGNTVSKVVDMYDKNLTHTVSTDMTYARYHHVAGHIADKIVFGGGKRTTSGSAVKTIEAYTVI